MTPPRARVVTAGIAVVLALCACGSDGPSPTPATRAVGHSGLDVTVGLDRQTGAITFPGDRFLTTAKERDLIDSAMTHVLSACVMEQGVAFAPFPPMWSPVHDASNYFGVWTAPVAETFAFVSPMTRADLRANGVTIDGEPIPESTEPPPAWRSNSLATDEAEAAIDACSARPEAARFDLAATTPHGPWAMELGAAHDSARLTQEWTDAVDDYHGCLIDNGLHPDPDDPLSVIGADPSTIDAEQITLALAVVDCKDQTHLVDRLAGQVAAFQAPVIDTYASDMTAHRGRLDTLVADARTYLATHGLTP